MRIYVAFATAALAAVSFCQDLSLKDALNGTGLKSKMSLRELPDSFRPVKIGSGETDYMSSMMPYMVLGVPGAGVNTSVLVSAAQNSWTDGTVVTIEGQRFLVTYKMEMDIAALSGRSGMPTNLGSDLSLHLVRVDAIKSLAPDPTLTKQAILQALSAPVPAMMDTAYATVAVQETGAPVSGSEKTRTINNMKQIALATIMYAGDYDDYYPYVQNTATLQHVTMPYSKNSEIWKTYNPRGGRFLFNMALAGVSAVEIPSPAEMPMFYEETPWHDGSRVVAFSDGHVKSVSKANWPAVEKQLKMRFKRNGKPLPVVKTRQ